MPPPPSGCCPLQLWTFIGHPMFCIEYATNMLKHLLPGAGVAYCKILELVCRQGLC